MRIIFTAEPFSNNKIDSSYQAEAVAADALGLAYSVIDFEMLVEAQNAASAVQRVKAAANELGIYRGWMLKPADYHQLYQALQARGISLINTPVEYQHCHYLPNSYSLIEPYTPRTVYLKHDEEFSMARVMALIAPFGDRPLIVKDFVKSRKHEWFDACFIRAASDRAEVERVVNNFLRLQGDDLNEGLVFREFIEFQPIGIHPQSGMPLTKEFRLFFLDGKLLTTAAYWSEADYENLTPPTELFLEVASKISSHFFTMDIAQTINGEWIIVELGDAQVAGLPDNLPAADFYQSLIDQIKD